MGNVDSTELASEGGGDRYLWTSQQLGRLDSTGQNLMPNPRCLCQKRADACGPTVMGQFCQALSQKPGMSKVL